MKTACFVVVTLTCLMAVVYAAHPRESGLIRDGMKRPCYRYDVDGCSIPFGLPFFYKGLFTRSCDRHDICYHCGVEYGFTKNDCDNAFREDTDEACENQYLSDSSATSRQQELVRASVKDLGTEAVEDLLRKEMTNDVGHYEQPGKPEFNEWFADLETRVRVGAAWVVQVAEHAQELELAQEHDVTYGIQKQLPEEVGQLSRARRTFKENTGIISGIISRIIPDRNVLSFQVKQQDYSHQDTVVLNVQEYLASQGLTPTVSGSEVGLDIISYLMCDFFSDIYYWAVAEFGGSSYHEVPEFYCNQSFVQKCLPQD